jgi:hypothetical protein
MNPQLVFRQKPKTCPECGLEIPAPAAGNGARLICEPCAAAKTVPYSLKPSRPVRFGVKPKGQEEMFGDGTPGIFL